MRIARQSTAIIAESSCEILIVVPGIYRLSVLKPSTTALSAP